MIQSKTTTSLFPPAPAVRASNDREQRLTDYVRGHTGADITVRLSAMVETAFVAPTTEAALVEADYCDLARDDAKRLVEQVDSEYFIAIPTQPARLEQLPIDDQLTADRAQQYGFALHELGHIRYTNIVESTALLNDAIEDAHRDFVRSLWNICEDAAIEHQLAADQSQIAADRLALLNQSLSSHSTARCEDTPRQWTFRDAVERALFEWGIYETGRLDVLCDPEDDRLTFQSVADRQAYQYVANDLREVLADILTTPDSIARTERLLECWRTVLKPLLDPSDEEEPSQSVADETSGIDPSAGSDASTTDATATSTESDGIGARDNADEHSFDEDPPSDTFEQAAAIPERTPRPTPEAINTESTQDTLRTNALEYPAIGEIEPAEHLAPDDLSHSPSNETDIDVSDHHPEQANDDRLGSEATAQAKSDSESAPTSEERGTSDTSPETADASPSVSNPWGDGQTTLGLFSDSESTGSEQLGETGNTPSASDQADQRRETPDNEQEHSPTDSPDIHDHTDTHSSSSPTEEQTDETSPSGTPSEPAASQTSTDGESEREANEKETLDQGTARLSSPTPAHTTDQLEQDSALSADERAAHQEADRATPDERALNAELADIAEAFDNPQTGTGATPDSLDDLSLMPDHDAPVEPNRWRNAIASAQFVGNTLRAVLRESRGGEIRSGLTSGTFDRRRVGALARGAVNVFQVRQVGEEEEYDLVIVLDRSKSMRTQMTTAEDALIRFALACEEIDINVAIIDFIDAKARLVKPFSVECTHVRGSLLSGHTGGGTPLTDALGLARGLLERRQTQSLILIVTDGRPGEPDSYQDELTASYAPVCGLTLCLGSTSGEIPSEVADNEQFYDRHMYVHDQERLDERLDQFAVMFEGL